MLRVGFDRLKNFGLPSKGVIHLEVRRRVKEDAGRHYRAEK